MSLGPDLEWVLTHDRFLEACQSENKSITIRLGKSDYEGAPSESAKAMLAWYVEHPSNLVELASKDAAKATNEGENRFSDDDRDLDQLEQFLLRELRVDARLKKARQQIASTKRKRQQGKVGKALPSS